jgi:hypothetical protein
VKHINTLVDDIYKLMETRNTDRSVDVMMEIDRFGEKVKDLMKKEFTYNDGPRDARTVRLSNIGKTDKYLWYNANRFSGEKLQPHSYIKFMYGHLIEEMLIFLTRMAGHEVTDEQKTCEVEGVKGHMDCKIDGRVVDIKSTSTFAFKKFVDGSLACNDAFGYVDQLKAYAHSEGEHKFGWLAMDKQNGHLHYLEYDETDETSPVYELINHDITERVRHVKKMVKEPTPPENCYAPEPDGKSGNLKLGTGCSYCQYKGHCYPDLRVFAYSTGPRFLVKVEKEPNVMEIKDYGLATS